MKNRNSDTSVLRRIKDSAVENLHALLGRGNEGVTFSSYSDLDAPINKWAFTADGGKIGSLIKINGLRKYSMTGTYRNMLDQLAVDLSSFLREQNHKLQFTYTFETNPNRVRDRLKHLYRRSYKSMDDVGLDLYDILDANIDKLASQYGVVTDLVLCVWTTPYGSANSPTYMFPPESPQSAEGLHSSSVLDAHKTLVFKIPNTLGALDVDAKVIDIDEALAGIRQRANPTMPAKWKPNTKMGERFAVKENGRDIAGIVPDKLSRQVTPGFVEVPNFESLYINDKVMVKSLDMLYFPRETVTFENLLSSISETDVPIRLTFTVSGGANRTGRYKTDYMLNKLSTKSAAKQSMEWISLMSEQDNVVVGLQMTASTWLYVPEGISNAEKKPDRLAKYHKVINDYFEKISAVVSEWGDAQPDTKVDQPLDAWTRNNAGFKSYSNAPMSYAPITDAFRLLPLFKMSPIWTDYAIKVMRTPQKELVPVNRLAANQSYSFCVVTGAMRSGKSVYLNGNILSLATFPGIRELPFVSFIDVGRTSFGTYDMIRDGLPESKKHQVVTYVFKNESDHAINPYHLQMGLRRPSAEKRDFLVGFTKLLIADEEGGSREGVEGVISRLIDAMYKQFDDNFDNSTPKIYHKGENKALDRWIETENYETVRNVTTYWELFDHFFEKGDYEKAHICQAYASPTLSNLVAVLSHPSFKESYANDEESTQLINYMVRTLFDVISKYPMLSKESMLNLNDSRFLALELGEVVRSGKSGVKMTAIMYFIAIDLATRNFFNTEAAISEMPTKYQPYHLSIYNKTKSLPKSLTVDEFHRTTGSGSKLPIAKQTGAIVLDLVRVFSKNFIEFSIASQLLSDISDELLELANIKVVLSTSEDSANEVIKRYGLDPSIKPVLRKLGRPGAGGSRMLIQNETDEGEYTHILFNTVSAEEIWGQVSNLIDVLVRDGAYKQLPKSIARKALAIEFPGCTAKSAAMDIGGDLDELSDEQQQDISDRLIAEVVATGKKLMSSDKYLGQYN
jgi:intracellular multiplication protein IcmB